MFRLFVKRSPEPIFDNLLVTAKVEGESQIGVVNKEEAVDGRERTAENSSHS